MTRCTRSTSLTKDDHIFGTSAIRHVSKEHRSTKWQAVGQPGIWVGHKHSATEYYQLTGVLYGQRSASLRWFKTLSEWLVQQNFEQGQNDPCIFHKNDLTVVAYVDDLICRGSPEAGTNRAETCSEVPGRWTTELLLLSSWGLVCNRDLEDT